jgi:ABC-type cobalamin/Fe3+-siderophores transport system ATPase subunit
MIINIPLVEPDNFQHVDADGMPVMPPSLNIEVNNQSSLVFVGANGAGKTRLGVHIEQQIRNSNTPVQRLAAQRSIVFKDDLSLVKSEAALNTLRFGGPKATKQHTDHNRWGQKPATKPLADFDGLLQALYAEQSEATVKENQERKTNPSLERAVPKLEELTEIWQNLLPTRELKIGHADVKVVALGEANPTVYTASELSDGERVIFYLIGQVLLAEENSILIIDEPELHIHKSILGPLWDEIEKSRPNVGFVYITHDLDFASSRSSAKIYAVEEFEFANSRWKITEAENIENLPQPTILKILGSRKDILFVEGENGKDSQLFRLLYPTKTIVERGACDRVISTVKAFQTCPSLHDKECKGIIDRDGRTNEECAALANDDIIILPVSEIENLLLLPEIWEQVLLSRDYVGAELAEKITATEDLIIATATDDIDRFAVRITKRKLDRIIKRTGLSTRNDVDALDAEWQQVVATIDIQSIAEESKAELHNHITNRNIDGVLELYDNKGMLIQCVRGVFSQPYQPFFEELLRKINSESGEPILTAIRAALPENI